MNVELPIDMAISLLKEIRDTTPIVGQRKLIDAFFAMGDVSARKDEERGAS
ncbi:hypothetical protein [Fimbriiglobus ruber]|uniref:hypothetical protein n=1 Tax=Fimbriiglobus ruber TaxID=1908690 RepID=UPI00137B0630|nr:hypothetical protein [Fimbriiglobus ruber]